MSIKNNYPITRPSLDLNFAGSKVVDPRVTFTRPSVATYYDGKTVAKAEENLWANSSTIYLSATAAVTRTNNTAVAPDGTTTAFSIAPTEDNVPHSSGYVLSVPATAEKPATLSFHAKANGYTKLWFADAAAARFYGLVDLNTAAITLSGGVGLVSASAKVIENGWVRVFITTNNTNNLALCPVPDSGYTTSNYGSATFAGDGVSGCYLWGFQAEQRAQATAYTPTTDQPITRYQPVLMTAAANTPRIDHDPITGECKGLLIEESRTNLLVQSEEFASESWRWASTGSVVLSNVVLAPNGMLTADKVVEDTTTGSHRVIQAFTLPDNADCTGTVYIKSAERAGIAIQYRNKSGVVTAVYFDLLAKTSTGGAEITEVGGGWFRLRFSFNSGSGASTPYMAVLLLVQTSGSTSYTGDGYSGIYIWGAQLEVGDFPTSYIPTASAQVTRAADNAAMTGTNFSSWYRQDEGTAVVEANWDSGSLFGSSSRAAILFADFAAPTSNRVLFYNADGAPAAAIVSLAGVTQAFAGRLGASSADFVKAAAGYKTNDFAYARKGGELTTDAQITLPNLDVLYFGRTSPNTGYLNGHIKRLTYYPKRLPNTQLQALTL